MLKTSSNLLHVHTEWFTDEMMFLGFDSKPSGEVPVVAQWLTNPTRNHEVDGSVPALAQWVDDPALP